MHRFYGGPWKVYSDDNGEYVILVKTPILMHGDKFGGRTKRYVADLLRWEWGPDRPTPPPIPSTEVVEDDETEEIWRDIPGMSAYQMNQKFHIRNKRTKARVHPQKKKTPGERPRIIVKIDGKRRSIAIEWIIEQAYPAPTTKETE